MPSGSWTCSRWPVPGSSNAVTSGSQESSRWRRSANVGGLWAPRTASTGRAILRASSRVKDHS